MKYSKTSPLRYTGTLDMQRVWERTLRRAGLSVSYSQGFHPQARINQAGALPLGYTSRAEMVDVWIEGSPSIDEIQRALAPALPPGIELDEISPVEEHSPSIQTLTDTAEYQVQVLDGFDRADLQVRVDRILNADSLPRQRREKSYDLRPLILDMYLRHPEAGSQPVLRMKLSAKPAATGRPDEVLLEMGIPPEITRIERLSLTLSDSPSK